MARNIDHLFGLPIFRDWLSKLEQPRPASFYFLWERGGNPQVPVITDDEKKRLDDLVHNILYDSKKNLGAEIIAHLFNGGDGLVATRLLEPYDEDFVVKLAAGFLAAHKVGGVLLPIQKYFDYLKNSMEEEFIPGIRRLNDLVVRILTDPSRLLRIQLLDRYVDTQQAIDKALLTKKMIKGIKPARELQNALNQIEKASDRRLSHTIESLEALALLTAMTTEIKAHIDGGETRIISIGVASAVDFLYGNSSILMKDANGQPLYVSSLSNNKALPLTLHGNGSAEIWLCEPTIRPVVKSAVATDQIIDSDKASLEMQRRWRKQQSVQSWIEYLLEKENLSPEQIYEIGPYPSDFNLTYKRSEGVSEIEARKHFIEFLTWRFKLMFDLANTLLGLIEAATEFDTTKFEQLIPWVQSGHLPMTLENRWLLPIFDNRKQVSLLFRKPLFQSMLDENLPLLLPIEGKTDHIVDVLVNVFFDKVSLSAWSIPSALFFLRPRDQMLNHLAQLSEQDRLIIKDLDFHDYLQSMGYPNMDLPSVEYRGYFGLLKAVEIHSLSHLSLGVMDRWLLYYPELVRRS